MEERYKSCPYCWEQIRKEAKKCRYCHEFLDEYKDFEVKLDWWKWNSSNQTNLKGMKDSEKEKLVHEKIFRNSIDYSYIKCCECGFEWLWWRKRIAKASDLLVRWAAATLIKETLSEDLVVCPICESSNVIETKYEKASWKDKFFAYWLPFLVFILIIIIICWIAN